MPRRARWACLAHEPLRMRRIDAFKLGLALCAVALFGWSVRSDAQQFRWAALACLLAAFLLRFIRPRA
jgi:hypothetical protein